jgi:aminopeptidase-like protein
MSTKTKKMIDWAKDLFPICRSITGEGTRSTLKYFEKINPELKRLKFKSGTNVFDWKIPKEWNIRNAYIEHESGKKFANFKKNNLHVVGYSKPINVRITKKELIKKIHSIKNQPDAIPYVTSYYNEDWGFCMSENEKKKLPDGKYKVFIDSKFKKGFLDISHALIKGKSKKEIFFSSYICHPSMANNELSGPVLLNAIMIYLKKYKSLKYSYRFALVPETIGSIAYLSKFIKQMQLNIICGFNLTCVGDERAYSFVTSRRENTIADEAIQAALNGFKNVKKYSYLDRGSDERQYCAAKVDLPLSSFSRSKFYPEYHTSKDNFKVVTQKGLEGSLNVMKNIIDAFELGLYPETKIFCEPNLGKRGLYPLISKKNNRNDEINLRMNLIAYADGEKNLFEIANILNKSLSQVCNEYKLLKKNRILK